MFKTLLFCALGAALLTVSAPTPAQSQMMATAAKPLLHPLFSENAVLQRDRPLTIWGWARSNADVTVKFDGGTRTLKSADDGYWSVPIRPRAAGGPYALEVSSGGQTETRRNLMFGDVWLCSGQSNMEMSFAWGINNGDAEKAAANYPNIRLLSVPQTIRSQPTDTFEANWQVCSPQAVGDFSAVGYFFGRKLNRELNVPIGLIDSSWGGTPAESWVSEPALTTMGDFNATLAAVRERADHPEKLEAQRAAWWNSDVGTRSGWKNPDFGDATWKTMAVPAAWEDRGYPNFDGVMWFRHQITIPADWAGRDLKLSLGQIDDDDTTYWNGDVIGDTRGYGNTREYAVPGAQVKAGASTLAIRVLDTGGGGGLRAQTMTLALADGSQQITLDGDWKYHLGASLAESSPLPTKTDQNTATALYNGMIAPLLPEQIKGVIWYQGESNASRAKQYRTLLPTLITDWRARFGALSGAPMPFYIVQLANYMAPGDEPGDDDWAYLREAQSLAAKTVPDTGIAVITDIGDAGDIHPKNKQDVGLRLALQALKNTYGEQIQADGPTLRNAKIRGGEIALTFDNADGLNLKGDQNRVFAIAGADKKFAWATPQITGNSVILIAPNVPNPVYARFGWSNNPRASLYNSAGLPASPFRTDS